MCPTLERHERWRGQDEGVRFAVELHGHSLIEQIETAFTILELAPGLGFTLDPSHFVCMEIPMARVAEIREHLYHVHLRNGKPGNFNVPMSEGNVDFAELKRMLSDVGYKGYAAIEYISTLDLNVTPDILELRSVWNEAGGTIARP
ncbi:MAG: sugar phosphate isomerase/epimerase [Lentisphaerales bacterium]|nr:MAG: sugar phosphate isomerase/epimerase [Lentisphaerales bacterium]